MQHPIPIEFWHLHIANDHVGTLKLSPLYTLFSVLCLNHLIPRKLQDVGRGGSEELVVLHDQNLLQSAVFNLVDAICLTTGLNLRRSRVVALLATKRDQIVVLVG